MTEQRGPLAGFRWAKRVVVMLADTDADPALLEQQARLQAVAAGLVERDVVLVAATGQGVTVDGSGLDALRVDQLRQAYAAGTSGFRLVLIGKDGGVKLRAAEPVRAGDLLALVDSMPMRQREMRKAEGRLDGQG
jgi:hypothetical protein